MQKRYFDYLTDVSQINLTSFLKGIVPAGIYQGCTLSVREDNMLVMSAGRYVTSSGMIVDESAEVEIASLADTSAGTSLLKTVLGLGPSLNTVQRGAIEYDLNEGRSTDADLIPLNAPYIILGFVTFDGNSWSINQPLRVSIAYSASPDKTLPFPLPGVNGLLEIAATPGVGVVETRNVPISSLTMIIPLNNAAPIAWIGGELIESTPGMGVAIELSGPGGVISESLGLVRPDGNFSIDWNIPTAGQVNALLKLTILRNGPDTGIIKFKSLKFIQDSTFVALT